MEKKIKNYPECYFPMTANVLTVGHIKCLEWLTERCFVTVGLLTAKALKGYKEEAVPFADRKYILDTIAIALEDMRVIPQDSLNPSYNLKRYHYTHMASGDGWEKVEIDAATKYNLKRIDIRLKGEKTKKYSSSAILRR
jgi:hypothetical protein